MNPENLVPAGKRTSSERRANARKAGIASGAARRRKRDMQELAREVLSMPLNAGKADVAEYLLDTVKRDADGNPVVGENGKPVRKNLTVETAAIMAQASKAVGGDVQALAFLRDTAGEKPVERVEVSADVAAAAADIAAMAAEIKADGR